MPRKRGDTRLRRWQKSVSRLVALYSSPVRALDTAKLMVVGRLFTPSCASRRVNSG
jgi:hypothetical protein